MEADKLDDICGNCGKKFGYHHGGTSRWPLNYCPDKHCTMDWENEPGTTFVPSGNLVTDQVKQTLPSQEE